MSIFSDVLTNKVFDLESCTGEELKTLANQFSEVSSVVASSLEAIGTMMFWASAGDPNGDNQIPQNKVLNTFSRVGELMQVLSALSDFSLAKEGECRGRLRLMENNEAPKTAIDGASNIQPHTI